MDSHVVGLTKGSTTIGRVFWIGIKGMARHAEKISSILCREQGRFASSLPHPSGTLCGQYFRGEWRLAVLITIGAARRKIEARLLHLEGSGTKEISGPDGLGRNGGGTNLRTATRAQALIDWCCALVLSRFDWFAGETRFFPLADAQSARAQVADNKGPELWGDESILPLATLITPPASSRKLSFARHLADAFANFQMSRECSLALFLFQSSGKTTERALLLLAKIEEKLYSL